MFEHLIADGKYKEALQATRDELKRRPGNHQLLMQYADIYVLTQQEEKAVNVLAKVADFHAASGDPGKAVAALKRLERIDRENPQLSQSLAERIEDGPSDERPTLVLDGEELGAFLPQTIETRKPGTLRGVDETNVVDEGVPSPLFDDFGRDELLAFIKGLELQLFDAGDIIVAEGDPGDSLFILTSGIAKAFVRDRNGQYKKVRTLHDGDFFGEISILSGGKRTATITAATKCELLVLNRASLDRMIAQHPRVKEVMEQFRDERLSSDRSM